MPGEVARSAERPAKIRIEALTKVFESRAGAVVALQETTMEVPPGQFTVLVGPSGCGKSTLLRILAGLEPPSAGQFSIESDDSTRPTTAVVFQEQSTLPWLTVWKNISFGLEMRHVEKRTRDAVVDYYLEAVGLRGFANHLPHQLSGGMRQRVSLARAFASNPEVLLMDEPFAALDEQNKALLHEELLRIWEAEHRTVFFITHDIEEAIILGDVIVVMSARPGRILQTIDVPFERPRDAIELRSRAEFARLTGRIWELLRGEVMRTREMESAAAHGRL